jgi:beta-lactamase regulating signal transducer with metallopeptidase domain
MSPLNLLLLAAEAALASAALPLLAALLARAFPRTAARRRLVWAILFAVLLALPVAAVVSPSLAVIKLAAPVAVPASTIVAAATAKPPVSATSAALLLGLYAWALGAAWIVARSLPGLVVLHRLKRGAAPVARERLPVPLPRRCRVWLSADCIGPMTWGVLRPVVLLPDDALDWPEAKLEAALRHELAHVRRKDCLVQALALLTCALYWPNPLVWRAARALHREAEAAADDAVLASGMRPSDYATLLLDLANDWGAPKRPELGMAMAQPPILTQRVQSILSPDAFRTGATAMDAFKFTLVGGVALAALALARPSVADIPAPSAAQANQQVQQAATAASPASADSSTLAGAKSLPQVHDQGPENKRAITLAQQDAPPNASRTLQWLPNPNGPAAPPAPGAEPAPANAPAAALVALPPLPAPLPGQPQPRVVVGFNRDDGAPLTPQERMELNRQLAAIGPKIEKALADAHIDEVVAKALKDAHIDETVDRAVKGIQPTIQKAITDARIRDIVAQRVAAIDVAVVRAQEDARRAEEQARRAADEAARETSHP